MRTILITFTALSLTAIGARGEEEAGETLTSDGDGRAKVSLEGDWQPYQTTPLTVRRTINIERDGQSHQADVTAPVLVRRGAVFLDPERIAEILRIRQEVEALKADILRVKEKSMELGERYARVIAGAAEQVPGRGEPDPAGIGGVAMRNISNENQDR